MCKMFLLPTSPPHWTPIPPAMVTFTPRENSQQRGAVLTHCLLPSLTDHPQPHFCVPGRNLHMIINHGQDLGMARYQGMKAVRLRVATLGCVTRVGNLKKQRFKERSGKCCKSEAGKSVSVETLRTQVLEAVRDARELMRRHTRFKTHYQGVLIKASNWFLRDASSRLNLFLLLALWIGLL